MTAIWLIGALLFVAMAFDFGEDLSCLDDLEEEGRTVTGLELISQAIVRRLTTPRGALIDDPDYGTDITDYLNETIDRVVLARMRSEVRAELLKDDRIVDVTVQRADFDASTNRIALELAVTLSESAIRLVLDVSETTVAIIEAEAA